MVGATPAAVAVIFNGCCILMATNPTITLFAIHVGQLSSCFFSIGLHPAALPSLPFREHLWPSLQVLAKPFNHQSHQSISFLTQKDHYNQMVCHITSEECYRLSLGQHSPSSVSNMLGQE
jgi:hypothetical protein